LQSVGGGLDCAGRPKIEGRRAGSLVGTVILMRRGCVLLIAVSAVVGGLGGCHDERRMAGQRVRDVEVQTVSAYGRSLDKGADAKEVVYVLLRAIADDVAAGDDVEAREAAFDVQLSVSAPDTIFARSVRQKLGRNENVRRVVWHWGPTLGHYAGDLPENWEEAERRLVEATALVGGGGDGEEWRRVLIELADPSGDANASVVGQFQLVRESGFWRVVQVGFLRGARHLKARDLASRGDQPGQVERGNPQ